MRINGYRKAALGLAMAITLLSTSPAFALRVTNLDKVPQTVELAGTGTPDTRTIQPGDTEYFTGNSNGRLSLIDTSVKGKHNAAKDDNSTVHADGMLSGVIGAERNTDIPTDPESDYVIWPGGHLQVQHNQRNGGSMF